LRNNHGEQPPSAVRSEQVGLPRKIIVRVIGECSTSAAMDGRSSGSDDAQSMRPGLSGIASNCVDESFGAFNTKNQFVNFFGNFVHLAVGDSDDSPVGTLFAKLSN
jgi:hypothetical protein